MVYLEVPYFPLHLRMKTTAICFKYSRHYRAKRSVQQTEKVLTSHEIAN